ncbi:MAG: hypothetical protein ACRDK2_04220 [Solirubrobacteraceae bacterium]
MQTTHPKRGRRLGGDTDQSLVTVGLVTFAVLQLALGLFMAVSPHAFYKQIGPFGAFNSHYIRDVATFYLAIGVGLALAVRQRSWRVPVLALTTVQYTLHSLNHLLDIGKAHPAWTGYFDFFSIAAASALLAWLLYVALNDRAHAEPKVIPEVQ